LENYAFEYDEVGNIVRADDLRVENEWPNAFKPASRSFEYDDLYRLTSVGYEYTGSNTWASPYAAENADASREQPAPQVSFTSRPSAQGYTYDWLGNISQSTDDSSGFWDRSTGDRVHGNANAGPHQLRSASNRLLSPGGQRAGDLDVAYDAAGNVTGLVVRRDGACLPAGASCWQRFSYEWNEMGQLSRARRWDLLASGPNERSANGLLSSPLPARAADVELVYGYDNAGQRVLKSSSDDGGAQRQTVYIFDSLELRRTTYDGTDYVLDAQTESVRVNVGAAAVRVLYAQSDAVAGSSGSQRVFLELSDYLGSGTYVIDRATGELVEFETYQGYGAKESDYRPTRWASFREPYEFGGKEEDVAVGLSYFGARYYSSYLGVWLSPDPSTIHELDSDTNPYAYVMGRPVMAVDPNGRIAFLAVIAIAALVSAVTSVAVQAATVGWSNIRWGFDGVLGAAVVGAVSGGAGFGIGGLVSTAVAASSGATSGALAGGFAGGAAAGGAGYLASAALGRTAFTGQGFLTSMTIGAYTGVASAGTSALLGGGAGGSVGGTLAGGAVGSGLNYAATGHFDPTSFAISLGISLASSVAMAGIREAEKRSAQERGMVGIGRADKGATTYGGARPVVVVVRRDPQTGVTTFQIRLIPTRIYTVYEAGYGPNSPHATGPHSTDGTLAQHEARHAAEFREYYTTEAFNRQLALVAGASISPETGDWQVQGGTAAATAQAEAMRAYYEAYVQWRQDNVIDHYYHDPQPTFQGKTDPWLDFSSLFSSH
jgi:RHS repeat-associated protein